MRHHARPACPQAQGGTQPAAERRAAAAAIRAANQGTFDSAEAEA